MRRSVLCPLLLLFAVLVWTTARAADSYLPHLTGATTEWRDILEVDNTGEATASFTITLYNAGVQVYSGSHSIGAHAYKSIDLKTLSGTATCGQVSSADAAVVFRLAFEAAAGGGVAEFLINDATSLRPCFMFANSSAGTVWKGLAVMNPGSTTATLTLYAIGGGGLLGQATETVGAKSRVALPHSSWFPAVPTSAIERIVVASTQPVCGITISGDATLSKLLFTQAEGLPSYEPPDPAMSDLAGVWQWHILTRGANPVWIRAMTTMDEWGNAGSVWTDATGDSGTDDNDVFVAEDGRVTISGVDGHLFLNQARNMVAGVGGGSPWMQVDVKRGSGYSLADLAGTWKGVSLSAGSWNGWSAMTVTIESNGEFTNSWVKSEGNPGGSSGTLAINAQGEVTVAGYPEFKGHLDSTKTVLVVTGMEDDGEAYLELYLKQTGVTYTQADLTGAWRDVALSTGAWNGWVKSDLTIDSSGMMVSSTITSSGESTTGSDGPVTISPAGVVSVQGQPLVGVMSADKNLLVHVETEDNNSYSLWVTMRR